MESKEIKNIVTEKASNEETGQAKCVIKKEGQEKPKGVEGKQELNEDSSSKVEPYRPKLKRKWSINSDNLLFRCMVGNKPAGINKHFRMMSILHKFNKNNPKPRSREEIWARLDELYDMQAIDELEFQSPNEWSFLKGKHLDTNVEVEFQLPDYILKNADEIRRSSTFQETEKEKKKEKQKQKQKQKD